MNHIEIKNFKRIENLKIDGFKRINLIGGCNNSGKSSILEAMFLLQKLNSLDIWNMLVSGIVSRTYVGDNFEKMTGLFYKFDFSQMLSISNDVSSIKMSLAKELGVIANVPKLINDNTDVKQPETQEISETIRVDIQFNTIKILADIFRNNIKPVDNISSSTISKPCFFVDETNLIKTGQQNYSIFASLGSIVSGNMKQELVDNALKMFDENIIDIDIIINKYNQPEIKIGHKNFPYKIPLNSYGVGLKRVLNIVMSIINSKGGVVLIDEIENGIHYSIMPKLWEVIIKLTKQYDCQLFATTHSQEYAGYIFNNNKWETSKNDFNFITLNLQETKIIPSIRSGDEFEYAVKENNSEVRG